MKNVRIWYKKLGRLKYISHLDMNRVMIRIIRRTGIPVWYTEGFNPHPYINFALPLSLGYESECEAVDMRVTDDNVTAQDIRTAFESAVPEGIEIISVTHDERKFKEIAYAEFELLLKGNCRETLDRLFSSQTVEVVKKTKKGGERLIDLKPKIKSFSFAAVGEDTFLKVILPAGSSENINPSLIIAAAREMSGRDLTVKQVVRKRLFDREMKIFG